MSDDAKSQGPHDWQQVRKKPVVVEAAGPYEDPTVVETIEGDFEVDEAYIEAHGGYYLIRGVGGKVYPCGVDIFERTYEDVEGGGDLMDDLTVTLHVDADEAKEELREVRRLADEAAEATERVEGINGE